jgi:hypothetical protein
MKKNDVRSSARLSSRENTSEGANGLVILSPMLRRIPHLFLWKVSRQGAPGHLEMKRKFFTLFLCLGLSVALLAIPQQTQATLGESADSVAADQNALAAVKHATTVRNGYSVHEFALDGTVVREYVSPSGIVFGVAWNGLTHPDLTSLLGSYADEYAAALQQTPRQPGLRRHELLKTDRVVVEKWGHMRNLQGRAYAPALIPPGVSADEIK